MDEINLEINKKRRSSIYINIHNYKVVSSKQSIVYSMIIFDRLKMNLEKNLQLT